MRIIIVGAGPAGLMLARILHVHGIETSVYERDSFAKARNQGGALDLHPETGQYALEAAGLAEQFHALARSEGEEHKIFSPVHPAWPDQMVPTTRSSCDPFRAVTKKR